MTPLTCATSYRQTPDCRVSILRELTCVHDHVCVTQWLCNGMSVYHILCAVYHILCAQQSVCVSHMCVPHVYLTTECLCISQQMSECLGILHGYFTCVSHMCISQHNVCVSRMYIAHVYLTCISHVSHMCIAHADLTTEHLCISQVYQQHDSRVLSHVYPTRARGHTCAKFIAHPAGCMHESCHTSESCRTDACVTSCAYEWVMSHI